MFGDDGYTDRLVAALLVSAVCVLLVGTVLGMALSGASIAGLEGEDTPVVVGDTQTDPSTLDAERDLSGFERQLARRVQQQVERGALNLSDGQYAAVREQINSSEYESLLDSYRSVASETGNRQQARNLTRLQRSLANYSRIAERYGTVYAEYRQERESAGNGGDARTVRLAARELERIHERATASGNRVLARFETLDRRTRLNVSTSAAAVRADLQNLTQTQMGVRATSFVETRLNVTASEETVAFDDPLTLSGRLRLANGTALANESVRLAIANRSVAVTTNATGWFSLTYRPTLLPVGTTNLTVQFEPADAAPYLGSTVTLPVDVSPLEPTVTVTATPATVGYNETTRLSGRVRANGTGVPGLPVSVVLDDRRVASATTTGTGGYAVNVTVPATVEAGTRRVDVRIELLGRAITGTNGSTTVTVRERETRLSVAAERSGNRLVRVTGRLRTDDGAGLPNQSVALDLGGRPLTTVRTGPGGRINTTVVVPRSAGGELSLSAQFEAVGLNLEPASAGASVVLPGGGTPAWLLVAGAFLALGVAVALVVLRRRSSSRGAADHADTGVDLSPGPEETITADPDALLSLSRSRIGSGDADGAVRAAYAAVRLAMDGTDGATHWEFYRARADDGLEPETVDALRDLTTAYERATYAADSVTEVEGEQALDTAESLAATAE